MNKFHAQSKSLLSPRIVLSQVDLYCTCKRDQLNLKRILNVSPDLYHQELVS